jgi:hypothetical protein
MARYKQSENTAILPADFFANASSREYKALARNASSSGYCRISAESATIGGRNATKSSPINPTTPPAAFASHL